MVTTTAIGSATTWVLLRGLGRGAAHWGSFPAQFQRHVPDARLVLPELPGNGARWRETSPARVAAMVDDLRDQLLKQGAAPPYHLLALSLGAMVAAEWARCRPRELAAAVLVNTSLRPVSPVHHRLRPGALARLLCLPARGAVARERTVLALTSRLADTPAATLARWVSLQRAQPVSNLNLLRQLLAAARYRAAPQPPAVPMLLLSGAADALVDPRCSLALARRWHVPLATHPRAGHDLPLDDGEWVAGEVARWLVGAGSEQRRG